MLDSTLSNPDPRYWISDFLSNLGLRIPIVSGIPDSKVHDSEFQEHKFPEYRILQEKVPGLRNWDYLKWVACVAWRFWLGALSYKGGRGQRNREEIGAEAGYKMGGYQTD